MSIENQRIIVVGGSKGLGRGIALALCDAGARVLALARNEAGLTSLARERDGKIDVRAGDAADPSFVAHVLGDEEPDVVFVVAGVAPVLRPIHEYRWESFADVWNNDVKATFHWLQDLVNKPMRDGGRVVVFSSGAALQGSPLSGGYAPAKQAQRYLCNYARTELGRMKRDIRVQCILPQLNPNTELGRAGVAGYAKRAGEDPVAFVRKRFGDVALSPAIAGAEMKRLLTDAALADAAEFMLGGAGLKALP
jgi:NAD(P)-dependent dehydrogenase (short-subunit alcohol dehydrogenase family)